MLKYNLQRLQRVGSELAASSSGRKTLFPALCLLDHVITLNIIPLKVRRELAEVSLKDQVPTKGPEPVRLAGVSTN